MKNASGQTEVVTIDPVRVRAMHAALGKAGAPPQEGEGLPHFWHWSQFWTIAQSADLGRDGHPKTGGFIPDLGLPRRMWAGGSLTFTRPLIVGARATRNSQVTQIERKTGKSGPLAFVTVTHHISCDDVLCISERQDLVYRDDPDPNAPKPQSRPAPKDETVCVAQTVTTTDLFRYSALTFNGHRIHYDLEYATEIEGYPGLVTHGPLLAQRLIDLAAKVLGGLETFTFRAVSPLFHFEGFDLCAKPAGAGLHLWVRGPDGRLIMTAEAQ